MTTVRELLAKLGMDSSGFEKGVDSAERRIGGLEKTFTGLGLVGGRLLSSAFAIATTGAALLGYELYQDVKAAADAQQVEAQLNAVLASTGQIAGVTADQAKELASSFASLTMFEDEAVLGAENVLLTFTSITDDVFPGALEIVLDMSQALGQDLKSSAIQVGKALQDPVEGANALRRVGVNLSDETQNLIKNLVQQGKVAEAQAVIMRELQTEFGGSAKAAGRTFAGQLTILKNKLGDIRETIGGALLPTLTMLATTLNEYLSRPETILFIQTLADRLAAFATWAVSQLPAVAEAFFKVFGWLMENQGVIVGAISAIGVAIAAFVYTTVIPAALAFISSFWPVLLIMVAVALVAYLIYEAWQANFGGIQQIVKRFAAFVLDLFFRVRNWLVVQIPVAIEYFKKVWETKLMPIFLAAQAWFTKHLLPLLQALGNLFSVVLAKAVEIFGAAFSKYVMPYLVPFVAFLARSAWPIIQQMGVFIATYFVTAVKNLGLVFDWLTLRINRVAQLLSSLQIPSWLTPGSPTPLEMGVRGIVDALKLMEGASMPIFQNPQLAAATSGPEAQFQRGSSRVINLTIASKDMTRKQMIEVFDEQAEAMVEAIAKAIGEE